MVGELESHIDDDDRIICRMDVEGMPQRGIAWNLMHPLGKKPAAVWPVSRPDQLTRSEARKYIRYSVLAGLSIVLVYSVALVLFILFCNTIWFR
jgi:hypothetical protein